MLPTWCPIVRSIALVVMGIEVNAPDQVEASPACCGRPCPHAAKEVEAARAERQQRLKDYMGLIGRAEMPSHWASQII